jgi:hypothetical protein
MKRMLNVCLGFFLSAVVAFPATSTAVLVQGGVKVEAAVANNKLVEHYWAKAESGWKEIAVSDGLTQGPLSLKGPGSANLAGQIKNLVADAHSLKEEIAGDGWTVHRTIRFVAGANWIRVSETLEPGSSLTLHSFTDAFRSAIHPTWSYSPSVGGFNPDGMYKAPLILVQADTLAFGVVPDLLSLDRDILKRCNHTIQLNVPEKTSLSVGFVPAVRAFHTVFKENLDRTWTATGGVSSVVENNYYLYVNGTAPPGQAYRAAVRFHWNQFGRAALPLAADEQSGTNPRNPAEPNYTSCHLWDDWRNAVWEQESPVSWLKVQMPDGTTGGAVSMTRADAPRHSVYLSAWFNSMRTAYGMALYARRTQNQRLLELAQQTLNLAIKMPGHDGAFKCYAVPADSTGPALWGAGDGAVDSVSSGYLGFDMSWTGYWMLKWREAGFPNADAVLDRCTRLANFLIARQTPEGMLPTRFDETGAVQPELSQNVPAETGPVVRFLFELYKAGHDTRYLTAAQRGLAYLDRNVVPQRKWFDFETFWSCSPRLAMFDQHTGQWPANNLALIHAVAAYLQAYQATHQSSYLIRGKALLDYLLLFQQSWTNPALENLSGPVMLLGGFTTQNSDGEWSDARQSLAGGVIMEYYRETGDAELLERGVEALRAQFPISPSENWAHEAYGRKAGISSFHWGAGSGMAGIEMEESFLRDAVCDIAAQRCVGVNGLNITKWTMQGNAIDLQISSPFTWPRMPVLVCHRTQPDRQYRLSVNGVFQSTLSGKQLEAGVPFKINSQP